MGWIKRTGVILASLLAVYAASGAVYYKNGNRQFENLAESNLQKIVKVQEEKLGIKYSALPRLEFVRTPFVVTTEYYPLRKAIRLTPVLYNTGEGLDGILNMIFLFGARIDPSKLPQILAHELGHAYSEQLVKEFNERWRNEILFGKTDAMTFKVIYEGIGNYFRFKTFDIEINVEDIKWPRARSDYDTDPIQGHSYYYMIGYRLVKPVIDQFGIEGIRYLLLNPPRNEDLLKLSAYQQRVLTALSK